MTDEKVKGSTSTERVVHAAPPCRVCSQPATAPAYAIRYAEYPTFGLLTWRRCSNCGALQQVPIRQAGHEAEVYGTGYYVFETPDAIQWKKARDVLRRAFKESRSDAGKNRLLEVGCAQGHLLVLARDNGWNVRGLDLSDHAVSKARRRFGLDVAHGTIGDANLPSGSFDTIIAIDVIEHVAYPGDFIRGCTRLLSPGGRLIIETPNIGSVFHRLGGRNWCGLNPFHITLLGAKALRYLLGQAGLSTVGIGSFGRMDGLEDLLRKTGWFRLIPQRIRRMRRSTGQGVSTSPPPSPSLSSSPSPSPGVDDREGSGDTERVKVDLRGDNLWVVATRPGAQEGRVGTESTLTMGESLR